MSGHPLPTGDAGGSVYTQPQDPQEPAHGAAPPDSHPGAEAHQIVQEAERTLIGAGYKDTDLVFPKPDGSPWNPSQFSSDFSRLVRRHGLTVRFHDVRHTHASQLLKAGVPVKVVSERLGHATASITLDVYSHVLPGMQADAVAKIDAALGLALEVADAA